MRNIPDEILKQIFQFSDAKTLLAIEETCKEWRSICRKYDEDIWKELANNFWVSIFINRPTDVSILQRISRLSTGKMVKMLRHIDLSRCIEKKDYQRMLLAKLVLEKSMQKELGGEDPRFKGRYLSMYYPDWSLIIPEYKASYFFNRKDSARSVLYTSELCTMKWRFRFKHYADAEGMTFETIFYEDGTMYSELQQQQYQWRLITMQDNVPYIQVDQYPPLSMKRLPTGSWRLENHHVIMDQEGTLDGESLPLE